MIVCKWFGEICSCCCFTVLSSSAWVLLDKTYKPFFLYSIDVFIELKELTSFRFCIFIINHGRGFSKNHVPWWEQ